jgi:hypothetical protein
MLFHYTEDRNLNLWSHGRLIFHCHWTACFCLCVRSSGQQNSQQQLLIFMELTIKGMPLCLIFSISSVPAEHISMLGLVI